MTSNNLQTRLYQETSSGPTYERCTINLQWGKEKKEVIEKFIEEITDCEGFSAYDGLASAGDGARFKEDWLDKCLQKVKGSTSPMVLDCVHFGVCAKVFWVRVTIQPNQDVLAENMAEQAKKYKRIIQY